MSSFHGERIIKEEEDPEYKDDEEYDFDEVPGKQSTRKSCAGRKLMRWTPCVDQLVLLSINKVCSEQNVAIPWTEVAHEVQPNRTLSGEAIKQHLAKLMRHRIDAGKPVPVTPLHGKMGSGRAAETLVKKRRGGKHAELSEEDAANPGNSLLWYSEKERKKIAVPKKSNSEILAKSIEGPTKRSMRASGTPKTPIRKPSGAKDGTETSKISTGKRCRKTNDLTTIHDDDSDPDCGSGSPAKKAKKDKRKESSLRVPKQSINYCDDFRNDEDNDDGDDVFEVKQEVYDEDASKVKERRSTRSEIVTTKPHALPLHPMPAALASQVHSAMHQQGQVQSTSRHVSDGIEHETCGPSLSNVQDIYGGLPTVSMEVLQASSTDQHDGGFGLVHNNMMTVDQQHHFGRLAEQYDPLNGRRGTNGRSFSAPTLHLGDFNDFYGVMDSDARPSLYDVSLTDVQGSLDAEQRAFKQHARAINSSRSRRKPVRKDSAAEGLVPPNAIPGWQALKGDDLWKSSSFEPCSQDQRPDNGDTSDGMGIIPIVNDTYNSYTVRPSNAWPQNNLGDNSWSSVPIRDGYGAWQMDHATYLSHSLPDVSTSGHVGDDDISEVSGHYGHTSARHQKSGHLSHSGSFSQSTTSPVPKHTSPLLHGDTVPSQEDAFSDYGQGHDWSLGLGEETSGMNLINWENLND